MSFHYTRVDGPYKRVRTTDVAAAGALMTTGGTMSGAIDLAGRDLKGDSSTLIPDSKTVAIGESSVASGANSTAVGTGTASSGDDSTSLGRNARGTAANSTALGSSALANGADSLAAGYGSTANVASATAVGAGSSAGGLNSIALGQNAATTASNSICINAISGTLTNAITAGVVLAPMRGIASAAGKYPMHYDTATGEIARGTVDVTSTLVKDGSVAMTGVLTGSANQTLDLGITTATVASLKSTNVATLNGSNSSRIDSGLTTYVTCGSGETTLNQPAKMAGGSAFNMTDNTLSGSSSASGDLTLQSTTDATKGTIIASDELVAEAGLVTKGASGTESQVLIKNDTDDDPIMTLTPVAHDNTSIGFDCHWNGSNWISSSVNTNWRITKDATTWKLWADASNAVDATITWPSTPMIYCDIGAVRLRHCNPQGDDFYDIGTASLRWDDIWATNSTINMSDAQQKEDIKDEDLGLTFIKALKPKKYRFKGRARPHHGLLAQDVETLLGDLKMDFAGFIKDRVDDFKRGPEGEPVGKSRGKKDVYGLRYGEFIAPMMKAIQELSDRLDAVETAVAALAP